MGQARQEGAPTLAPGIGLRLGDLYAGRGHHLDLLIPVTLVSLYKSFHFLYLGDIGGHRKCMQSLYFSACIVAGGFTFLPGRYLGNLLWQ